MENQDNNALTVNSKTGEIINSSDNFNPIQELSDYAKRLNELPNMKEVKLNKFANDSKYLPISFVEMTLDEIFLGLWKTKNFTYQVIANEIVASLDLEYFHPIAKVWLSRVGAAGVQIQMDSGLKDAKGEQVYETVGGKKYKVKDPNFRITDIERKIQNTLTKDFPHLKAACMTNAARDIAKIFGRDLNREHQDYYTPFYSEDENQTAPNDNTLTKKQESEILEWIDTFNNCNTAKELFLYIDALQKIPDVQVKQALSKPYNKRKAELK